ncbi:MAG TPA: Hsp20/alpha crystallin family protein [Arenicellales bacterium]|nr:Hsp20/alpha crystallin family protein [Arenicellales bacterium]
MNEQQKVSTRSDTQDAPENPPQSEWTRVPEVDIYEDPEGIHLTADMPGVSRERLDIQANRDALTIEGEAAIDMPEGMQAMYADVRSTRYRRSFALSSELDTGNIDARLKDGVLSIFIPRRAEARPRKIEINTD